MYITQGITLTASNFSLIFKTQWIHTTLERDLTIQDIEYICIYLLRYDIYTIDVSEWPGTLCIYRDAVWTVWGFISDHKDKTIWRLSYLYNGTFIREMIVFMLRLDSETCGSKCEISWWRHQMETFSALLALCAGNSPVPGEFPVQRPVTRSFDVYFDLRLNKRLSKQWWGWWFGTQSCPLWRHSNALW